MNNDSGMNGKRDFQGKNRETNRLVNRALIATILLVVVALLGVCACGYETLAHPAYEKEKETVILGGKTLNLEVAATPQSRAQGLGGRASLGRYDGMLFVFSVVGTETFWMHGMRFPIDIIWVRTCRIVGLSQDLPPPTLLQVIFPASLPVYPSPAPIDMAIEVGAGTARELGLKIGDVVIFSQGG